MKTFNILLVDDEPGYRELRLPKSDISDRIRIFSAACKKEALEIIQSHLLHVAFCDIRLSSDDKNLDGLWILAQLQHLRPSCRRFLMTQWADPHRDEIFQLLRPDSPVVEGLLDKGHYDKKLGNIVIALASEWFQHEVTIANLADVISIINRDSGMSADASEIECALSRALGQGGPGAAAPIVASPNVLMAVEFTQIAGGKSGAVVFKGKPSLVGKQTGVWIVAKVAPREDCRKEVFNYESYVRWTLSLNRRVELLSHSLCDTIGAVCYTFAYESPENVTSLETMFKNEDEAVPEKLESLFSIKSREWYAQTDIDRDIGDYFHLHHGLDPNAAIRNMREFLLRVAAKFGLQPHGDRFSNELCSICLPVGIVGSETARGAYRACIVHGDLNAANIIVAVGKDEHRVAIIDFSDTGPGPACLDFAVLQVHLRILSPQAEETSPTELLKRLQLEHRIWHNAHAADLHENAKKAEEKWPFWARISCKLYRYCLINFPDVPLSEQIAVYVLWALRMDRLATLTEFQRMRILIWMSALVQTHEHGAKR